MRPFLGAGGWNGPSPRRPEGGVPPGLIPTVLKAIFFEEGINNSGDHYDTIVNPATMNVTVFIFNKIGNKVILLGQFVVSEFLLWADKDELIAYLYREATVERALGAGWYGIDRPVIWS